MAVSRAVNGLGVGGLKVRTELQYDELPLHVPDVDIDATFTVGFALKSKPVPDAFEPNPQLGALTVTALSWKLIAPDKANTHACCGLSTLATAVAPMVTVDKPSIFARYPGCV